MSRNKIRQNEMITPVLDVVELKSQLSRESWSDVFLSTHPNQAMQAFYDILNRYIDECSVVRRAKKKRNPKIKPWITHGIIVSIHKRNTLYQHWRKYEDRCKNRSLSVCNGLKTSYITYRNMLSSLIKRCKREYYENQLRLSSGCAKKLWNVVNQITSRKAPKSTEIDRLEENGEMVTDRGRIPTMLNEYFVGIANKLVEQMGNPTSQHPRGEIAGSTLVNMGVWDNITDTEVGTLIDELKNSSAVGPDGIKAETLKSIKEFVVKPLCYVINLTMNTGVFPASLKDSIVVPVHKGGTPLLMNNYRPISLVSQLAKVFEKAIKRRLLSYVTNKDILAANQYGFRAGMGTEDALYKLTSTVSERLDQGENVLTVFLDLRKAFDTVNHDILLKGIERQGIGGNCIALLADYLRDRTQRTRVNGEQSQVLTVEHGVPQGTVLGPLLFLLYINDLCRMDIPGQIVTFADDTSITVCGQTWIEVYEKVSECLKKVNSWLKKNLLSLNYEKTVYVPYSLDRRKAPREYIPIRIHDELCEEDCSNCAEVKRVQNVKYLGVYIDSHLKWTKHVDYVTRRLRGQYYIYKRLIDVVGLDVVKMVYYSLTQSIITYG
jgi:hypothetical protein